MNYGNLSLMQLDLENPFNIGALIAVLCIFLASVTMWLSWNGQ